MKPVTVVPKIDTFYLLKTDEDIGPGSYEVGSTLRTDIGSSWGREQLAARARSYSNLGPGYYKIVETTEPGVCGKCI